MYDELERAAQAGRQRPRDAHLRRHEGPLSRARRSPSRAGCSPRASRPRRASTTRRKASLAWVADNAGEAEYRAIARLRLAGLLLDAEEVRRGAEAARRGRHVRSSRRWSPIVAATCCLAQGKNAEAQAAYQKAWSAMDPKTDYRRLVEAKLNLLGVQPAAGAASAAEAAK